MTSISLTAVAMAIACWALNKVYVLVTDKIQLQKEIINIRGHAMAAKTAAENSNKKVDDLKKAVSDLKMSTQVLAKNNKDALAELAEFRNSLKKQDKVLEDHGKVIEIMQETIDRKVK